MPYRNFSEFYAFYLTEHSNRISRRLHFTGTSISLGLLVAAANRHSWGLVVAAVVQGYALAWIGHFFFEHNRPATFRHPLWSFMGDWKMWWDILRRRVAL